MENTQSNLKRTVKLLIDSFNMYAGAEGCCHSLTRDEFKNMVQTEMPELLKDLNSQSEINSLFNTWDSNNDGWIEFKEFAMAVATLAKLDYEGCQVTD